jgi:hypothetical protein
MGSTCETLSHERAIVLAEYYVIMMRSEFHNITENKIVGNVEICKNGESRTDVCT